MNEAGVHAQTIDGYQYVRGTSSTDPITLKQRLKEVVMYRLMEDKCYDEKNLISANVFGSDDNAKLYKYFNDNFADIILEMVGEGRAKYQIFRNIDSYGSTDQPKYFMNEIMDQEKLGDLTLLQQYVGATIEVKRRQRILSAIESADNKIYEYRKTQIDNAKNRRGKKRYENGLLAPMPVKYLTNQVKEYGTAHHYSEVLTPITFGDVFAYFDTNPTKVITRQYVRERTQNVINKQYITQYLASIIPNSDEGFSPQIQKAKEIESNRF
ncbi:MAG: hypothetical protein MJ219_03705 [Mycoplasmoidaceae bacterium]|nr:hypothetical protein [Mycoplasmoidaceae bacterium]